MAYTSNSNTTNGICERGFGDIFYATAIGRKKILEGIDRLDDNIHWVVVQQEHQRPNMGFAFTL